MISDNMKYSVGPLIYMPGLREDIADKILDFRHIRPLSVAVCLEDTISDSRVEEARKNAVSQIYKLGRMLDHRGLSPADIPSVFIRVRSHSQIKQISDSLGSYRDMLCGFILPKIDDETIQGYISVTESGSCSSFSYMPIIENPSLLRLSDRYRRLDSLKKYLLEMSGNILNVRVGGNDFCRSLALRCPVDRTVYDFPQISSVLSDIMVTLGDSFVVSAPVWNYFENGSGNSWKKGMEEEMKRDAALGFVGKTVIHPSQIPVVNECMKVSRSDYNDAMILKNTADSDILVVKGSQGSMLEHKTHMKWAEKILAIGNAYGIKD